MTGKVKRSAALVAVVGYILLVGYSPAHAALIAYSFSTNEAMPGPNEELNSSLNGSSLSGTFLYDPTALQTSTTSASSNPPNAPFYGSGVRPPLLNLAVEVTGGALATTVLSATDERGLAIVSNEGFNNGSGDLVQLLANNFSGTNRFPLVPFTIGGYTLFNVRMFWQEHLELPDGSKVPELVDSDALPPLLPPFQGRVALDFVLTGSGALSPQATVFYAGLIAQPSGAVPEPQTPALLVASLALLGFFFRRRLRSTCR